LIYGRSTDISKRIEEKYQLFNGQYNLAISVVSLGELDSLAKQFNYGESRKEKLNLIIEDIFKLDVNRQNIIDRYGDIDAFSQGKLVGKPSGFSSRNMGKNDLWIAATTQVTDSILLTTDRDFDHLDKVYFEIGKIDLNRV